MAHQELPHLSKYLFWDCDYSKVDFDKNSRYIIEKVVTRGQLDDWHEIRRYYGDDKIKEDVINIRSLPYRVMNFLSVIYNIPPENFRCYTNLQSNKRHWFY